jgi:hypothetical protein
MGQPTARDRSARLREGAVRAWRERRPGARDHRLQDKGKGFWELPRAAGTNCRPMSSDETAQEHFGIRGISWITNKISKIATAAGLGLALAFSGGIQNSAVQLDSLDTSRLEALRELLAPFVKKLNKSTNEISSFNSNTKSWPFKDESVTLDAIETSELGLSVESHAYSGIASGSGLQVDVAQKQVTTIALEQDEEEEEERARAATAAAAAAATTTTTNTTTVTTRTVTTRTVTTTTS